MKSNELGIVLCLLFQISFRFGVHCGPKEGQLKRQLLKGYNRFQVPFRSENEGIIGVWVYLLQIHGYDYHENTLSTTCAIELAWEDVRLNWENVGNSTYTDISYLRLDPNTVWFPHIKYHGFTQLYYPAAEPYVIVDSLGMARFEDTVEIHSPCKRWSDEKSTLSVNEYECKIYMSVTDPQTGGPLNVELGVQSENEEKPINEVDVHLGFFYEESSINEILDSKIRILENYHEHLPNRPDLTIPKLFEVRFKIRIHHATRKLGFYAVIACALLIGLSQFLISVRESSPEGPAGHEGAVFRYYLGFTALMTFLSIGVASNLGNDEFKFIMFHIVSGQILTLAIIIVYNSMLVTLRNHGKLRTQDDLTLLLDSPRENTLVSPRAWTDISDFTLALILFVVFIITVSL